MNKFICTFCQKEFSTKGNLKLHQKSAKYCLTIRGESEVQENFNCEYCDDIFIRKSILYTHYEICKNKKEIEHKKEIEDLKIKHLNKIKNLETQYKKEINILNIKHEEQLEKAEQQIKDLQNQIKELASLAIDKPNTINHNVNNNSNNRVVDNRTLNMSPFNLTEEKIMHILKEKFEEKHLMRGQESLADFCVENILVTADKKFLYRCSDPSRNHFIYLDEKGKIQKDINGHHLIQLINEPVRQRTRELYQECSDRYFDSENNEENEEQTDKDEDRLMYISNKVVEITSLKNNNSKFLNRLKAPIVVNK